MLVVELKLPLSLATKQDVALIHRELSDYIDAAVQIKIRKQKPDGSALSPALKDVVVLNQIDINNPQSAQQLLVALNELPKKSQVFHMSFATNPTPDVTQKLIEWFRKEINPRIILSVGVQPTIAAGVILKTQNRQYDFSLRKHLELNRSKLVEVLHHE
jgi:F0F1-type ATP synthase delta subunit